MRKLYIFGIICGVYSAQALINNGEGRMANRSSINITEVPYQVAFGKSLYSWCGGTIVSEQFVITAAHCFKHHDSKKEQFAVFVGMTNQLDVEKNMIKKVKKVTLHPQYNRINQKNDIAVLELEKPLNFSDKVRAVKLPDANATVPSGEMGYVSGWGYLTQGGPINYDLHGVAVKFLKDVDCKKYPNFFNSVMICAGSLDGSVDTCQGDSGGPLVYDNVLYGIVSFGRGCGKRGFPGVYSKVANLRDFIDGVIN